MLPLLLGLGVLLLMSSKRQSAAPMVYDPQTGEKHPLPDSDLPALPPGAPASSTSPKSPAPVAVKPQIVKPGDTLSEIAKEHGVSLAELKAANPGLVDSKHQGGDLIQPGEKVAVPEAKTLIPQPKGASGNLPEITRPLARAGFQPEKAHQLAPQVLAAVLRGPQPSTKTIVRQFQLVADLMPRDGVYGPRTAGALQYFLARPNVPTPKTPPPHTKDKRIIPYAL